MWRPKVSSVAGFQSPHMWRPEIFFPFSVPMPLYQRPTQSQFTPPGHSNVAGYGGGYHGQPQPQFPSFVSPSSGMPSSGLPVASAFTAYTPGTGHVSSEYSSSTSPNWYLDSGATNHVTSDLSNISHLQPYPAGGRVMGWNGNSLSVSCFGNGIYSSNTQGQVSSY